MREIVLASTSPYRRAQLARFGIPLRAIAPPIDEDEHKRAGDDPRGLAARLARLKAESLRAAEPSAVIIGADQLVAIDGEILGKPKARDRAIAQLERLAGREHALVTAVAVSAPGALLEHVDVTRLVMRHLSRAEIERYVDADAPLDCAGSYKIEERGLTLFERIVSDDHSAITGLPLLALCRMLREFGIDLP